MIAAENNQENVFLTFLISVKELFDFETQKKILCQTDSAGQTAIFYSLLTGNEKHFEKVMKVYEEICGVENVKKMIFSENENRENTLFLLLQSSLENVFHKKTIEKTIEELWSFMTKSFDKEKLKRYFLCHELRFFLTCYVATVTNGQNFKSFGIVQANSMILPNRNLF